MVVQVLLLLSNLTQGSWMRIMSVVIIIIIIVHFMLAAYRLWHSTVQDLGIQPIFSISLHRFSASILVRSTSFCSFVCPLSTGIILHQFNQQFNAKGKEKTKEMIMKDSDCVKNK